MRDPRVERLFYRLRTAGTVTFKDPPPVTYEAIPFKAELAQGQLTVEMNEDHPFEQSARARVEEWLRAWEIAAGLAHGPDYIRFEFERSEIIDRNPPGPGEDQTIQVAAIDSAGIIELATVNVTQHDYPQPPTAFKASSDVVTMWSRYQAYKQRREPLPSMAYFCLTVIEGSTGLKRRAAREEAARRYNIDLAVLDTMGELTSTKGGSEDARKYGAGAMKEPLSQSEINWLDDAVKLLIRRKAEYDFDPTVTPSPALSFGDLPRLEASPPGERR